MIVNLRGAKTDRKERDMGSKRRYGPRLRVGEPDLLKSQNVLRPAWLHVMVALESEECFDYNSVVHLRVD